MLKSGKFFLIVVLVGLSLAYLVNKLNKSENNLLDSSPVINQESEKRDNNVIEKTALSLNEEAIANNKESDQLKEVKTIKVVSRQFNFEPNPILVKEGDFVRLEITTEDVAHGFALPDYDINERIEIGETKIVEFTANKKGEFAFFCSVFCGIGHREMNGKLIVE